MGTDSDAVVDGDLRLRGTSNVRIADASVFPTMTTVNPMVTVLLIGERAADIIAGKGEPCHGS
jgi:choline dehydrogenase